MNDSHPSGTLFPADTSPGFSYAASGAGQYEQAAHGIYAQQGYDQSAAYGGYSTGGYDTHGYSYDADPLFGSIPDGSTGGTDGGGWTSGTGTYDAYSGHSAYDTGTYDSGAYSTGAYDTGTYNTGAYSTESYDTGTYDSYETGSGFGGYDTGTYDTNATWASAGFPQTADVPVQPDAGQADFGYSGGQWDAGQWEQGGQWDFSDATGSWDAYGYDQSAAQGHDGAAADSYESHGPFETHETYESYDSYEPGAADGYGTHAQQQPSYDDEAFAHAADADHTAALPAFDAYDGLDAHGADSPARFDEPGGAGGHLDDAYEAFESYEVPDHPGDLDTPAARPGPDRDLTVAHLPGRRRSPRPRRSALLTVAVPSVAVMGVAAAAAASVAGNAPQDDQTTQASADVPVKPANKKLDTQLAGLSADADDFADRASRAQERLDLQARQEAERKRKAKEAARKEALRPKFALPVKEHGLSATYGQAGLNWMSVHTGIDFPVSEGTPVMAATDGTVTTKYDVSFGNMAVVTAPDGTETWYCHLSSTKIRSGQVKAGDTIGYSGTSGNSTGPHLHFEVHPGGGDAIDPLPWLRGKGLDPE
ncbi:M23 family metallopeptidase [Streptomyces winkii]|uniref:M23 family metallopeptidase n=1 Tax=Streptomyces winkii TaxID=3051178 RepID=UPI0028D19490|nr:M23 family metallopeptidase [Streptomyces sp. DSM 40971]